MTTLHVEQVVALLLKRWWTVHDLGYVLGVQPKLAGWYVRHISRGRVVFSRRVQVRRPGSRGPNPVAYRLYLEAFSVGKVSQ